MRTTRIASLAALAVIVALATMAAGCGGDDNDTTTEPAATGGGGGGGKAVTISETEYKLDPSDPSVSAGKVTFEVSNDGAVDHALEVEGPGEESETETIAPGDSQQLTVDLSKPGSYEMYCPIANHKELGMEGEITVK